LFVFVAKNYKATGDVIFGNSAPFQVTFGSATATGLGNLSGASTQTQADELIGEWFLGTNLPSLSLASVGQANLTRFRGLGQNCRPGAC
jgi:hypothetical protein